MKTIFLIFIAFALCSSAENNNYNVLFIAVDDLRPELGCYGVDYAQSPHLDSFAKEAVLFNRHYVQVPTCGASRFALLTGRSPKVTKALGNAALYKGKNALDHNYSQKAQSLPEVFKRSGYKTACIGKISHQPDGRVFAYNGKGDGKPELPHAWDEYPTPFGAWKRGWGTFFAYEGGRHREDGKKNKDLMEFTAQKDTDLPDGLMAETAMKQLEKWKNERFFIGLGFYKPHLPFVAPKQDWDAFEGVDIPNPQNLQKPEVGHHGGGEFYKYDAPFAKTKPLKQGPLTDSRRAYLACVRYVDRQIGKVLKKLKELDLEKNTIVVVWGDHGWFLGDMQMWGKHSVLEEANRSVYMIKVPGQKAMKTNALAETIDIFPTLLDFCNPKDKSTRFLLDGVSQKDVISGKKETVRKVAISYWQKYKSIRTDTHRLITGGKKDYLYEMEGDFTLGKDIAAQNPELIEKIKKLLIPQALR
ncbi:MAG: sulfatase [Lentisphaeraceae bacterium]|nr:sulfatase [Lentisphaeraceae bacterium]